MKKILLAIGLVLALATPVLALQATITWTGDGVNAVRMERRDGVDANPFVSQGTVAAGTTSFNQSGLVLSTRYCYRPVAFNGFGDSVNSPIACGTPDVPLPVSGVSVIFAP